MRSFIRRHGSFLLYCAGTVILAAFIHRDILFNFHAFGRHWDWSFYPLSDFYVNYIKTFFYALKPNYLGYYDILSINLVELSLKSFILFVFRVAQLASLTHITIPVIYKTAVFVLFPLVSSVGVWGLCSVILPELKQKNKRLFFICALTANLFYTFSLLIIFDLHGGALNRQLSSVFFPFIWAVAYRYFLKRDTRILDPHILTLALFFAIFDISNIFYFAVVSAVLIFVKKQPVGLKIAHFGILGITSILINFYWVHAFFIGNQLQLSSILYGRRPDYLEIFPHSASFTDILFALKTPHDQITRLFGRHPFLYIPGVTIFLTIFAAFLTNSAARKYARTYIVYLVLFFFTVALAGGTYSFAGLHQFLYNMPFFSFIGGALRYMPNVLIFEVLLFLFSLHMLMKSKKVNGVILTVALFIPAALWIVFLTTRGSIITLVYNTMVGPKGVNHEAAALYDYDEANYAETRAERLEYNILPVPSWYSPIYTGNIYPKTSQGSVIDNFYFGRGMLYTNTTPLFSSEYFKSAVAYPNPLFYSFSNVGRIMYGPEILPVTMSSYNFSPEWTIRSLPESRRTIEQAARRNRLAHIPEPFFYPHIYAPARLKVSSLPSKNIFSYISPENAQNRPLGVVLKGQNTANVASTLTSRNYSQPVIEYKKLNPTKYQIIAHNVSEPFPLIISTDYYPGWKLNARRRPNGSRPDRADLSNRLAEYKVLRGNTQTQATPAELASYIKNGWISTLGDGREQTFTHYDYRNERETPVQKERYTVEYISKNIKGTIQNNNLDGAFEGESRAIPDAHHFTANGYANGWIIDPRSVCGPSRQCDIDMVAEFYPQRYFGMALAVTMVALVSVIIAIFLTRRYEPQ